MTFARQLRVGSVGIVVAMSSTALVAAMPDTGVAASRTPAAAATQHHVRGDFDGDGRRDSVIGAPGGNRVRVSYTHAKPGGSKVHWFNAPETSPYTPGFGYVLAPGDFNGDGYCDLAVGAPSWTNPTTVGANRETQGAIYFYRGSKTGLHLDGPPLHGPYNGEDPYNLGSMAAVADIDKDGRADLAFKTEGGDTRQIEILYGTHSGLNTAAPDYFDDYGAQSMAFGDIDGNGHPDLVLGDDVNFEGTSHMYNGDVQVIYGSAAGLTNHHRQRVLAGKLGVRIGMGEAIAAGDINQDGYADVVVGDPAASHYPDHLSPGKVVVLYGARHGISATRHRTIDEAKANLATHTRTRDLFGWSIEIGTVNGDRFPDVLIGAPGVKVGIHKGAGAVYLLRGSKHGVRTTHAQRLTQASHGVPGNPQSNANFGDVVHLTAANGDALLDAVIGAPKASYGATHGGFVVTLRGSAKRLTSRHARGLRDTTNQDLLGSAIAG
jgi:hypothetical protein